MPHYTHIELDGCAYSPISAAWPPIGPITISFDLSGGQYGPLTSLTNGSITPGGPVQTLNMQVDNFQMTLNTLPYGSAPGAYANAILQTNSMSGLAIFSPNQVIEWQFLGQGTWSAVGGPGTGGIRNEATQMNFIFKNVSVSYHLARGGIDFMVIPIPEPPLVNPFTCLLLFLVFRLNAAPRRRYT